jgi:hypothetical protein
MRVQRRPLLTDLQGYVRAHWRPFLIPILAALVSGPLGALGLSLWSGATKAVSWPFALLLSPIFLILVAIVLLWLRERGLVAQSDGALTVANRVISSDEALLRLLPGLVNSRQRDRERAIRRLAWQYLQDARHVFQENVARASILRPGSDTQDYLVPWAHYQMPQASLSRTRFYVGQDEDRKRGVAGKAYVMRQVLVVHIRQNAIGHWEADDPDYQVFDTTRADPPYRSFVAVPILGLERDVCLGVLCFDSPILTAFDSEGVTALLLALGTRIAAVIRICEALATPQRPPGRPSRVAST